MWPVSSRVAGRGSALAWAAMAATALLAAGLAGCSRSSSSKAAPSGGTAGASGTVLTVLVTNDDGYGAPGIDAVVQGLRSMPGVSVTVVAPATNQSGTGGKLSGGPLTVTDAATASGYPAKSVHGYPADTIVWAIDDHGISFRPDLVVSGINFGQNIGPLAGLSGTVGAAKAAAARDIPALAASQGVDDGLAPDFPVGVAQVEAWVTAHRSALLAHRMGSSLLYSLNVPTCAGGKTRGTVTAPLAATAGGSTLTTVDCSSSAVDPATDVAAFDDDYAVVTPLPSA
jgi:5'-nucleotidase